jgi:hypothetical protein
MILSMLSPDSIPFPTPLDAYPPPSPDGLLATLAERVDFAPFNAVATAIFVAAIVHTFAAARFTAMAHHWQQRHDARSAQAGRPTRPSVVAEALHFFGEVEGRWPLQGQSSSSPKARSDGSPIWAAEPFWPGGSRF